MPFLSRSAHPRRDLGLLASGTGAQPGLILLYLVRLALAAYAVLELVEAVGLWLGRRWAEHLTLVARAVFIPLEIYELSRGVSPFKLIAFSR